MKESPKIFLSHASEDKGRFVIDFAKKLRSKGVDAWLDKWEMGPGDSLVDKIFEEGIKEAEAIIVVISKNSVDKAWVREEINAAFVKRINHGSKLIPVVIDECEIPECLKSIVWININDLNNYELEFERIVMSIYGQYEKPTLGESPDYIDQEIYIPGLAKIDGQILKMICEVSIAKNDNFIQTPGLLSKALAVGISEQEFLDSLEVLHDGMYIKGAASIGARGFHIVQLTSIGMDSYLDTHYPDYQKTIRGVGLEILNKETKDSDTLAKNLNQPHRIIEHVLERFEQLGFIRNFYGGMGSRTKQFLTVSPTLKRWLEQND